MGVQNLTPIMADRVSGGGKRKTVQFRGMFVWVIVFYVYSTWDVCVDHCILRLQHLSTGYKTVTNAFQRPTRLVQVNVFL